MPETDIYFNDIKLSGKDELNKILDDLQDVMIAEQKSLRDEFEVSEDTASAIQYLRTRSRWTAAKELELINRDKLGTPIPLMDVLSGEF